MIKKIIIFIVVLTLLFYCAACKVSAPSIDPSISQQTTTTSPSTTPPQPTTEANFDTELIKFLEENYEFSTKNYVFSPLSYKYALLLATYGANGTTQEELYKAMGYENLDDLLDWGKSVNTYVKEFETDAQKALNFNGKQTRKLTIANSVCHNKDEKGTIKKTYSTYLEENFNSETHNIPHKDLVSSINDWANGKTNGPYCIFFCFFFPAWVPYTFFISCGKICLQRKYWMLSASKTIIWETWINWESPFMQIKPISSIFPTPSEAPY